MKLGIDISSYLDEIKNGARYYDGEKQIDPVEEFVKNGVSCVRLRLWKSPFGKDGGSYLGGGCDIENFITLAGLVKDYGMSVMLDFHYSDFWADPSKQFPPAEWKDCGAGEIPEKVYSYTRNTLIRIKNEGIFPEYIQIGNEITNGMLWPYGKLTENEDGSRGGYAELCRLLISASGACREIFPQAKLVLHLERSGDKAVYGEFFTNMENFRVDYDIIGVSYYPYWHGTPEAFFDNMRACRKFGKPIIVAETGYGFTFDGYEADGETANLSVGKELERTCNTFGKYPFTPEGQANFIRDFLCASRENGLYGVFYWEPLWIPGKNIRWTSEDGLEYIREKSVSTLNGWANQCLFDYSGRKLPAFDEFR